VDQRFIIGNELSTYIYIHIYKILYNNFIFIELDIRTAKIKYKDLSS